jgi:hypothetical protein
MAGSVTSDEEVSAVRTGFQQQVHDAAAFRTVTGSRQRNHDARLNRWHGATVGSEDLASGQGHHWNAEVRL